jgi:bacillopeptidase F (M6 metalloprotease family)
MQILNTEEKEGIDAAKALIEKLKTTQDITENEQAALAQIEKYFQNKGSQRTGDIAMKIAAFAVEKKYGKTARKIFIKLSDKYRNSPTPAPAVATNTVRPESQ